MTKSRVTPTLILPTLAEKESHGLTNYSTMQWVNHIVSYMPMIPNYLKHNFMHNHIVL